MMGMDDDDSMSEESDYDSSGSDDENRLPNCIKLERAQEDPFFQDNLHGFTKRMNSNLRKAIQKDLYKNKMRKQQEDVERKIKNTRLHEILYQSTTEQEDHIHVPEIIDESIPTEDLMKSLFWDTLGTEINEAYLENEGLETLTKSKSVRENKESFVSEASEPQTPDLQTQESTNEQKVKKKKKRKRN